MSLISRGLAAVAAVAAISGAFASPASSHQASAVQLSVFLPDVLVGADSVGTLERVTVAPSEPLRATNLTIQIDTSGLAGVATVTPQTSFDCSTTGAILKCLSQRQAFIGGLTSLSPNFAVKPLAGVASGASGIWRVTVSADGLAPVSDEASVQVAESVDLGVPVKRIERKGAPGAAVPQALEVDNVGERAADGAVALFYGDPGITTTKEFSNCTFDDEGQPTSCTFDEQLAPGTGYRTSEDFPFNLRTDTLAPSHESIEVEWMTKADFALFRKELADEGIPDFLGRPGTGGKLSLVARTQALRSAAQTDIDNTNNWLGMSVEVEGDNDADFAATGGSASGAAGQVVTLNLGFKNLGPASRDSNRVGGGVGAIDITLPPGSSLAAMPEDCRAMKSVGGEGQNDPNRGNLAARFIRCDNPSTLIRVGNEVTFPVKLRIDQVITGATGSVAVVTNGCDTCRQDKNPANDTASVVLNAALAVTGVQTGLLAGTGALLALAGVAAFAFGRRRRFKPTPETD